MLTLQEQYELEKLRVQDHREIKSLKKELQRKEKAMAEMVALLVLNKIGKSSTRRTRKADQLRPPAQGDRADQQDPCRWCAHGHACSEVGICLSTLKRWLKIVIGDGVGYERRKVCQRLVAHKLSQEERQRILLTCYQAEYSSLPPGQIVPPLAD